MDSTHEHVPVCILLWASWLGRLEQVSCVASRRRPTCKGNSMACDPHTGDVVQADQAVTVLAQYRPFEQEGLDASTALSDLVLAAIMEAEGRIASIRDCQETLKTLWGLDVEIDELRSVLATLVRLGRLHEDHGAYRISEAARSQLDLTRDESASAEHEAFEEWKRAAMRFDGSLTADELELLQEDLELWLSTLIKRHGIETALILYPEVQRAQRIFDNIERLGLDFLPSRSPKLDAVREPLFYLFIRQPTAAQRVVLATRLNTAYFLTLLSLDPAASRLLEKITAGQRVYLDTNAIYRILNLSGPSEFLSTRRLLELTRGLKYSLAVTPWTIKELRTSLNNSRNYLSQNPIPASELAELAASATTDQNFITAYWQRLRHHPISVQDFYDFYSDIEGHLAEHDIEVVSEGCKAVERDSAAINRELATIDTVLRSSRSGVKPDLIAEHDVKHRLLIMRLRGSGSRTFANAGYWFLTYDSSLPRYDNYAGRRNAESPFCVSASAWLQAMRSFTPRTDDFDQTLTDLLSSPYIRYRGRIGYDTVQQVVARIDLFKGKTPELAAKVLLNTALVRKVAEIKDRRERIELIDNAVVVAAEEMAQQLTEMETVLSNEQEARTSATSEASSTRVLLEQQSQEVARLEKELQLQKEESERIQQEAEVSLAEQATKYTKQQEEIAKQQGQIAAGKGNMQALESRLELQEKRYSDIISRARFGSMLLAIAVVLSVALALILRHVVSGAWPITALILGCSFTVFGVTWLLYGLSRAWKMFLAVAAIVGLIAAVQQLVQSTNNDSVIRPTESTEKAPSP
jgi:hypothetical protein